MELSEIFIAVGASIILGLLTILWGIKNSKEVNENDEIISPPKFEPRKITDLSKEQSLSPKKKYYKKKKKKPTNLQVEKKPVGRPRKTTE